MSSSVSTRSTIGRESTNSPFSMSLRPTTYVAYLQGIYFFLTGVWPLVSIDTFQMVTGPKTDLWLAQTVGALVAVVGSVLLVAAWRRRVTAEIILLALGSAVSLGVVDVVFVVRQVIAPIYLLDVAAEAVLVSLWLVAVTIEARRSRKRLVS